MTDSAAPPKELPRVIRHDGGVAFAGAGALFMVHRVLFVGRGRVGLDLSQVKWAPARFRQR